MNPETFESSSSEQLMENETICECGGQQSVIDAYNSYTFPAIDILLHFWLCGWFIGITVPSLKRVKWKTPMVLTRFIALISYLRKKSGSEKQKGLDNYYTSRLPSSSINNDSKGIKY